jgi:hypothetical protein
MKTVTITENLPESICKNKLQQDISTAFPGAVVEIRHPISWVQSDQSVVTWVKAVLVSSLEESVIDQDVINIVTSHNCGSLWGLFPETDLYRTRRRKLIDYVTQNAQSLTTAQLKEASQYFATPAYVRDMFFTMDEQIILGEEFNKFATQDRQIRHDRAMSELMNYLTYAESIVVVNDLLDNGDLTTKYIKYGVEGTSEGDPVGLFDYFESTVGTIFENNGFLQKTFIPRNNVTIAQLSVSIMDIFRITV